MNLLQIVVASLISVAVLFIITKLIGYRQVSELSLFDYINSITIGSIAAEMAISRLDDIFEPLIAMAVYGAATLGLSIMTNHSIRLRRLLNGKPVVLMEKGKLYDAEFKRLKLDLNEFLSSCRNSGYFDLSRLDTVVVEPNGKLSFLPVSASRPVTPSDLEVKAEQESVCANVIIDGRIMPDNLASVGYDEAWLRRQLSLGGHSLGDVFLATCATGGSLNVFERSGRQRGDKFE